MAPSPSPDPVVDLRDRDWDLLLDLAERAIVDSLAGRTPTVPAAADLPPALRRPGGLFVTVKVDGALNGCIGTVEGPEPLGQAVVRLACSAAFADPRLPALTAPELPRTTIEVSVLSPLSPIPARSWAHLVSQLRPGVDGVVLRAGRHQGLFLPAVWEELPDPVEFTAHLYRKAGLPPRSWPEGMEAFRFTAERRSRRLVADRV